MDARDAFGNQGTVTDYCSSHQFTREIARDVGLSGSREVTGSVLRCLSRTMATPTIADIERSKDMGEMTKVFSGRVPNEWIDYNGHMGDYAYAIIFSDALTSFMDMIGVDAAYRSRTHCTIYTLEIRIAYLNECHLGQKFHVVQQILDLDSKRFHAFLSMIDAETGQELALCEQLLMHMQQSPNAPPKSRPFPEGIAATLLHYRQRDAGLAIPDWVQSKIGIRRNSDK